MATNDLMTELQKDNIKLDDDSEKKVVKMLLRKSSLNILLIFSSTAFLYQGI